MAVATAHADAGPAGAEVEPKRSTSGSTSASKKSSAPEREFGLESLGGGSASARPAAATSREFEQFLRRVAWRRLRRRRIGNEWRGVPAVRGRGALLRILGCCTALAVYAPTAQAGTYDVWGCALPDGSPAPTDGWAPSEAEGNTNSCGAAGGENEDRACGWRWCEVARRAHGVDLHRAGERRDRETGALCRHARVVDGASGGYAVFYDVPVQLIDRCDQSNGCSALGVGAPSFAAANRFESGPSGSEATLGLGRLLLARQQLFVERSRHLCRGLLLANRAV